VPAESPNSASRGSLTLVLSTLPVANLIQVTDTTQTKIRSNRQAELSQILPICKAKNSQQGSSLIDPAQNLSAKNLSAKNSQQGSSLIDPAQNLLSDQI
jgi:hypothetical protein